MKARTPILATLLVASSLALALPAHAHRGDGFGPGMGPGYGQGFGPGAMMGGMRGGPGMGGFGGMRGMAALDLTDAQRDQIFKIRHEQAPALREKMEAAHKARLELHGLAGSANYDSAKARQLADAQAKAMADATLLRTEMMNKMSAVLTPEQRAKWQELQAQRGPRGPRW